MSKELSKLNFPEFTPEQEALLESVFDVMYEDISEVQSLLEVLSTAINHYEEDEKGIGVEEISYIEKTLKVIINKNKPIYTEVVEMSIPSYILQAGFSSKTVFWERVLSLYSTKENQSKSIYEERGLRDL